MKILVRVVAAIIGLVAVWMGVQIAASESGEVVILTTRDESGADATTRVWVVDLDGYQWLRAGAPNASWFARLKSQTAVKMERDGRVETYAPQIDMSRTGAVNALMLEKYGWAERYIGFIISRADSVPIRLVPASAAGD